MAIQGKAPDHCKSEVGVEGSVPFRLGSRVVSRRKDLKRPPSNHHNREDFSLLRANSGGPLIDAFSRHRGPDLLGTSIGVGRGKVPCA